MRLSLLAAAALFATTLAAHADGIGSSVTGGLYFHGNPMNFFDPTHGGVPAGYKNTGGTTVKIGPGVEFGYQDSANFDTANFTGSTLSITDQDSQNATSFEMTFTDPVFTGFTQTNGTVAGYTFSFSGDTLDVFYAGSGNPGTFTGNFSYSSAVSATPEPSSIALLGTGLLGVAGAVRRRLAWE